MHPIVIDIESVHGLLHEQRCQCSIEVISSADDHWTHDSGALRHKSIDFFEICAIRDSSGRKQLMIQQREPALVGLLCASIGGERFVMVSARCEPGLHNTCQLTTTIQSTPSNYLQRHQGASTPFLEYFVSGNASARVLHDSQQSDWGDYYLAKTKRFRIIEVDELLATDEPQHWIRFSDLRELLSQDYVMTSDLRVAAVLLHSIEMGQSHISAMPPADLAKPQTEVEYSPINLEELRRGRSQSNLSDDYGRFVVFVDFSSASREVRQWQQPLLALDRDKEINLWLEMRGNEIHVAVSQGTQIGLQGIQQWFPAKPNKTRRPLEGSASRRVETSAEGGRFYRHGVTLRLNYRDGEKFDERVEWWSLRELISTAAISMSMSLELRMISSLLI